MCNLLVDMRAPSPESSCQSSDCEGDKVVHALKRMKIESNRSIDTAPAVFLNELKRKPLSNGSPSPMIVDDSQCVKPSRPSEAERRKQMMEMLQNQLRQYKSQYSTITEGPDIAPCG